MISAGMRWTCLSCDGSSVSLRRVIWPEKAAARTVLPAARSGWEKLLSQAKAHHALDRRGFIGLRTPARRRDVVARPAQTLKSERKHFLHSLRGSFSILESFLCECPSGRRFQIAFKVHGARLILKSNGGFDLSRTMFCCVRNRTRVMRF